MITLSVAYGSQVLALLYKDKARAQLAYDSLKTYDAPEDVTPAPGIEITDDFGQTLWISSRPGFLAWDDMDLSRQGHIERALHQARTQHDAQNCARSDPKLRMGGMGGPSVITPFGPGPN